MRLHVRRTARKHEAIESVEQVVQPQLFGQRGNQQWQAARSLEHSAGVFVPHDVKRVQTEHTTVGRNTD
jgi:hypothetical protein